MAKIKLFDLSAQPQGEAELNDSILVKDNYNQAVFDQVIAEDNGQRQGTHSTLTKGEVRGGGRKPVPQKHTGNARQGSTRNPHWVGGGVAFGPKPGRNYKNKVNSKVSKLAFKAALTQKIVSDSIIALVDEITIKKPSSKSIAKFLKSLNLDGQKVLFALNDGKSALALASRNIKNLEVKQYNQVSVKDLLKAKKIVYQNKGIENLMEVYK